MAEYGDRPAWNLHPIKIQFLHLRRVSFEANVVPESASELIDKAGAGRWTINVRGNVQGNQAIVVASVVCSFEDIAAKEPQPPKPETPEATSVSHTVPPYRLEVETIAGFGFDPKEISPKEVDEWCKKGSFFIICPYIRHVIAEVTRDSGFPEVYLPLLEVPTFRPPRKELAPEKP